MPLSAVAPLITRKDSAKKSGTYTHKALTCVGRESRWIVVATTMEEKRGNQRQLGRYIEDDVGRRGAGSRLSIH